MMLREKMETLIFALIASYNAHRQQEPVVAAPEEFPPFDLQELRNSSDNKSNRRLVGEMHTCHKAPNFFEYKRKI
jgi:hypothetical protein